MELGPKPVTLTVVDEEDYTSPLAPQPLVVVGDIPVPAPTSTAITAVPETFADLAAVRTYLNTLVTELKASPYFS